MPQHAVNDLKSAGSVFYLRALEHLLQEGIPVLVGGAYALECHTGIVRRTKDFDIFVLPEHVQRVLNVLTLTGYQTELTFPHWLAKAYHNGDLIDIIFNSGNGVCRVDQEWFDHAVEGTVLGLPTKICPAEETIWQKAFIFERDRCDLADVLHLIRARAQSLNWRRLLHRFGEHWRVLYVQLALFGFVFPPDRSLIPEWLISELTERLQAEQSASEPAESVCYGTLLSANQYTLDLVRNGYRDARLPPHGTMFPSDILRWTSMLSKEGEYPNVTAD